MAEKYKATPNNPLEDSEIDLKKQKKAETKDTVEDVAKTAATAYLNAHGVKGPAADLIVDKAAENKNIQRALNTVSKNNQVQKVAEKAKPVMDMAKPLLDAKGGGKAGGMSGGKSILGISPKSSGNGMTGIPKTSANKSSSETNSNNESSGLSKGNNPLSNNPFSNHGSGSKDSTEIQIIKFLVKHPYILVAIAILFLLLLIIIMFLGYNNSNSDSDFSYTYEQCKEITVVHADGTVEDIVPLEDYIMGVVNGEVGVFKDLETAKAIAVAARTYVVRRTDSCTKPAEDSSNFQEYNPENISELTKEAVTDTAGEVLKKSNGDFVSGEYDAFCYANVNDNNYVLCQPTDTTENRLEIPVTWAENVAASEGSSVAYLQDNSHGRGMSQFGAYYLSTVEKKDYKYILHYFYGEDVVISTMVSGGEELVLASNGKFLKRTIKPKRDNAYYYAQDNNNFGLGGNEGECAWYAVRRTNEIINTMGLTNKYKNVSSGGDGGQFCDLKMRDGSDNQYSQFKERYTDVESNNIKPGTLFSYKRGDFGHVGIIEDVEIKNGKITRVQISEAYLRLGDFVKAHIQYNNIPADKDRGVYYIHYQVDSGPTKSRYRKTICEDNGCMDIEKNIFTYEKFINYMTNDGKKFQCYMVLSE